MSNSTIIKKLFFIGLKFKKWFIITLLISLAVAFISTYRPILTKEIVDLVIIKEKSRTELMNGIYLLLGMVLLETFLQVMLYYLSNFIAQSVIRDIRERLYAKLIHFKTSFFDKTPIGNLVTRAVGDVETVAVVYTDGFLMVFGDVLRVVMVIGTMFMVNKELSYIVLMMLPLMYLITRFFQKKLKVSFSTERNLTSVQNSFVQERLAGMSIIQVFNRQKAEFDKFDKITTNPAVYKEWAQAYLGDEAYLQETMSEQTILDIYAGKVLTEEMVYSLVTEVYDWVDLETELNEIPYRFSF